MDSDEGNECGVTGGAKRQNISVFAQLARIDEQHDLTLLHSSHSDMPLSQSTKVWTCEPGHILPLQSMKIMTTIIKSKSLFQWQT